VAAPDYARTGDGVALLDIGFGRREIVAPGPTSAPYSMRWYENPRDHGGNARTDPWISRTFGSLFDPSFSRGGMSYETLDVNNDGRMDIVAAQAERPAEFTPVTGVGISWYEAPLDPRAAGATWVKHAMDSGIQDVHKLRIADVNGDGRGEILFAEQEQSSQDRVGILYNWDGAGNDWKYQILSTGSGHNLFTGDIDNDGDLDFINAPHGVYGAAHPIELYVNQRGPVAPAVVASSLRFDAAPHRLQVAFNTIVAPSLGTSDLNLVNLTTGGTVPAASIALDYYDPATNTATFSFPEFSRGVLPDGRYRATITASGVTNPRGNTMAGNAVFDFFFLSADANHDAKVGLADFNLFASNFGRSGVGFAGGDFNYDGLVNLSDFNLLAARFGYALP
jgi:hypothetical protein